MTDFPELEKLNRAFERFEKSFKELLAMPYSPPQPPSPPPTPVTPPATKQQTFVPEPHQRSGWLSPQDVAFLKAEIAKTENIYTDESKRKKQGW